MDEMKKQDEKFISTLLSGVHTSLSGKMDEVRESVSKELQFNSAQQVCSYEALAEDFKTGMKYILAEIQYLAQQNNAIYDRAHAERESLRTELFEAVQEQSSSIVKTLTEYIDEKFAALTEEMGARSEEADEDVAAKVEAAIATLTDECVGAVENAVEKLEDAVAKLDEFVVEEYIEVDPEEEVEEEETAEEPEEETEETEEEPAEEEDVLEDTTEIDYDLLAQKIVSLIPETDYDLIADKVIAGMPPVDLDAIADRVASVVPPVDEQSVADRVVESLAPIDYELVSERVLAALQETVLNDESVQKIANAVKAEKEEPEATEEPVEEAAEEVAEEPVSEVVEEEPAPKTVELSDESVEKILSAVHTVNLTDEDIQKIAERVAELLRADEKDIERIVVETVIEEEPAPVVEEEPAPAEEELAAAAAPAPVVEEYKPRSIKPVVVPVVEDDNKFIRYKRSFVAKIIGGTDDVKEYYSALKNAVLAYKNARSQINWTNDRFSYDNESIIKIGMRGKTLCLYLALNPDEFPTTVYHQTFAGDTKMYESTPMMVKIKSATAVKRGIRLIDLLMERTGAVKEEGRENIDYAAQYFFRTDEELLAEGLIKTAVVDKVDLDF